MGPQASHFLQAVSLNVQLTAEGPALPSGQQRSGSLGSLTSPEGSFFSPPHFSTLLEGDPGSPIELDRCLFRHFFRLGKSRIGACPKNLFLLHACARRRGAGW